MFNLRIMFISRHVLGCSTRVNKAHTCTRADPECFVGLGGGSSFYNIFLIDEGRWGK